MQSHAGTIDDIDYVRFCACFAKTNFLFTDLNRWPLFARSQRSNLSNMVSGHMAY